MQTNFDSTTAVCVVMGIAIAFWANRASAQITPDRTLPNNSRVTLQDNMRIIEGGTQAGSNLFHSFKEFSIPIESKANFNNASNIQNIISRVTGKSVWNINRLIDTNGRANLFLINPNGIIFAPNTSLNIRGLVQLPTNLVDVSGQIANGCTPGSRQSQSSFIVTGRGGLPISPNQPLEDTSMFSEWVRLPDKPVTSNQVQVTPILAKSATQIVEAQGWLVNGNGDVVLVTQAPQINPRNSWQAPVSCPSL